MFPFYLLILVGLGLFGAAWSRERLLKEVFLLLCTCPVLIFLAFHIEIRYFAPAFPILLIWTANGLAALGRWLCKTVEKLRGDGALTWRWSGALKVAPAIVVLVFFAALLPQAVADGVASLSFSHKEAGLWLREHTASDALVMSRDAEVAFYAERDWVVSPFAEYEQFMDYARHHNADYLVVDQREATVVRPQLGFLLDEEHPPPELEYLYTAHSSKSKAVIYRIRD